MEHNTTRSQLMIKVITDAGIGNNWLMNFRFMNGLNHRKIENLLYNSF